MRIIKKTIIDFVNEGGGAVQFHSIGELCVSTFDEQYNKTESITSIFDDINKRKLDVEDIEVLTDIYLEIKNNHQ